MHEYIPLGPGEETTSATMSYFPARDVDEAATKEFVHGENTLIRMEFHDEISTLRTEMWIEISTLRTEVQAGFAEPTNDVGDRLRRQLQWIVGTQAAIHVVVVTLIIAFS